MRALVRLLWVAVAWTAVVWVGRIRNVFGDDNLSGGARFWRIAVSIVFLVLAAMLATVALGRWHRRPLGSTRMVAVFCLWTIVFWTVRGGGLLFAEHDAEFKLVHTALAVVSIGLAGLLYRVDQRVTAASGGLVSVDDPSTTAER